MPSKPKLQKLTFYLLKEGLDASASLRDPQSVRSYRVASLNRDSDALYVASSPPHPPGWRAYLESHVTGALDGLATASSSAVLLLEADSRLFAVTFGQGRHLLNTDAFEQDFGLKVVLNTVAPDQLKSVDAKTIDETTVHTRRDVSRDSTFSAFGFDVSRDLLRAVTGTPQDETLAHRLTGADALGIHTRRQVPELPDLASRLLSEYHAETYKANFDFVDYLRPERRTAQVKRLEDLLIEALRTHDITDVHLAAPEPLNWLDLDGFKLSNVEHGSEKDPRISTYLAACDSDDLSIGRLKSDRLTAIRASDGYPMASWAVYRCLVYQVELDGQLYVFSAGDWFRVDLDFKEQVYSEVRALPQLGGLPAADVGTDEGAYNEKAAAAIGGACLDRRLVYEGSPDKMEICDILTRDGGLIHVKQRGSSSTLSHLFAQGVNSAERLLLDHEFRSKARGIAKEVDPDFEDVLPVARPSAADHEVSFVVITRSTRDTPLTLPFFSLVSLRAAARSLDAFGFRVSVAAVTETAS